MESPFSSWLNRPGLRLLPSDESDMREVYARYFFSLFDAAQHQDDIGRRQAQAHLEDFLTRQHSRVLVGAESAAELA